MTLFVPTARSARRFGVVGTAVALAMSGGVPAAETAGVIAKGGTIELNAGDVRSVVATLPEDSRKALRTNLPALEEIVRSEVVRRAILADARTHHYEQDPSALKQLEHTQQEALLRLWIASKASVPQDYPSEADVKSAYEALRSAVPLEYHIAQIFISAPDGGDPARVGAALRKVAEVSSRVSTADFAQLAREQSDQTQTATKGGDMGFLPGSRLLPDVLKALKSASPGQVVGPIKTAEGLHFIKLIETRPGALPPLPEVHQRIVADLRARRAQQLQQAYLREVTQKSGVSVNEIELAKLQAGLN